MNKAAIKKFAIQARKQLLAEVEQRAYELGITRDEIIEPEVYQGGFRVNHLFFTEQEKKQRDQLIEKIKEKGFDRVIEEVAYTWFNRFIALRFMEVNDYLPTGVRVLSSEQPGKTEPDIITEALNVDLDVEPEKIYQYQDANDREGLYKYLLIKQCNALHHILPLMFEKINDYTELLLPNQLLHEGSVIRKLVTMIPEEDWKNQVEIIGWLYQFYISEKKDEVFAGLKKNKKITKENIPAATQLFTPKWIVQYMVENSLGRLWLESHPNEDLKKLWKYYIEEAEQNPEVQKQFDLLKNENLNPEDITVLDPAMGSGHILVYAFDVLYQIYLSVGYAPREIPKLILEKNIFGLDIDDRAAQLAYFSLMMKARSYNRRIFREPVQVNLCAIQESNGIPQEVIDYFVGTDESLRKNLNYLIEKFKDAKEFGSLIEINGLDLLPIEKRLIEILNNENNNLIELSYREVIFERIVPLIKQAKLLTKKYDIVVTNPPYKKRTDLNNKLSKFLLKNYSDFKQDLYTAFIKRILRFTNENKYFSMITQSSYLFKSQFGRVRKYILNNGMFNNIIHLGPGAFEEIKGEVVQSVLFTIKHCSISHYNSISKEYAFNYLDLTGYSSNEKERQLINHLKFRTLERMKINYMNLNDSYLFINHQFTEMRKEDVQPRIGCQPGSNLIYFWWEMNYNDPKWVNYNKGGSFRKWYGNSFWKLKYGNGGEYVENNNGSLSNSSCYFKEHISWTRVSSRLNLRYYPKGFIFDNTSPAIFENILFLLGYYNSKVAEYIRTKIFKGNKIESGHVKEISPIKNKSLQLKNKVEQIVKNNIILSKNDWDSFETSWDFNKHPFLIHKGDAKTFEQAYNNWAEYTEKQFNQLKANEEELNRIFIELYNLEDELTPEVPDEDVTIRRADRERDVKSFISYAVGCMLGRYSLDKKGLVFAGGEFDPNRYRTFKVDEENIIPITDDEYFDDDIVTRFVEFVKVTFGEEKLEENLNFIADTLGKKENETARHAIRRYFLKDFYKDHVQTYKKRPIYWLFDSGKQNGFKALIYMHRYDEGLVARVRTDYLHVLQRKYEAELKHLDTIIESDVSAREKNQARKKKEKIQKQLLECQQYDEVLGHVANQKIAIDLDDGVKVNYNKFQNIEVPQGGGKKPLKMNLLAKIKL